VSAFPWCPR